MSEDQDYLLALELQKKWNQELPENDILHIPDDNSPPKKKSSTNVGGKYRSNLDPDYLNRTSNLVHPQWETLDPTPDSHALFRAFDDKFFQQKLRCVTLEWSKRMYSCAGICYSRRNGLGMSITIRLSEPLLKLRSRKDLVETMLHEMIHAYCFVLGIREGNGGHGPNFKKIMNSINQVAGTNITVYHTFHDEVNVYKTHWWRCNGSCQHRSPFFGYVKRTSNRAPGPNDIWWSQHHHSCGGTFMKIKEPEKVAKKTSKKPKQPKSKAIEANNVRSKQNSESDLRKYFPPTSIEPPVRAAGFGGPVKSNGGGTLLLNPKTKPPSTTTPTGRSTTPTAPRQVRSAGNLTNVVGFKDLGEDGTSRKTQPPPRDFSSTGKGYSLADNSFTSTQAGKEVDRNHLRDVWLKKFGNNSNKSKNPEPNPIEDISGNAKRRRLSLNDNEPNGVVHFVADEASAKPDWIVIDEDVMVHEVKDTVIDLSSSSDDEYIDSGENIESPRNRQMVFADANERQKQIKKEILDDSDDLTEGDDDDIVLIDDEFDDDALSTSMELADTSLVDDLFGEDTLLKEFKNENAVVPSCSRYNDPNNDIITCPICQEKMKRQHFSEHLDGCVGITVKIEFGSKSKNHQSKDKKPRSSTPKKRSPTSTLSKRSAKTREILLSAGYTEEDIDNLPSSEESTNSQTTPDVSLNLSDRQRRTQGLYTQTRPCPACCREVDINRINEHLDECLEAH